MKNDAGLLVLVVRMASAEVFGCDLDAISVDATEDPKNPPMVVLTVKRGGVEISPDEDRQLAEYMQKMRIIPIPMPKKVCPECGGAGYPMADPKCGRCQT